MKFSTKKRFIAGVVCPKCGLLDKLVTFSKDNVNYRECVACSFKDEIRISSLPNELTTRVNASQNQKDHEVSPVRFIDPK